MIYAILTVLLIVSIAVNIFAYRYVKYLIRQIVSYSKDITEFKNDCVSYSKTLDILRGLSQFVGDDQIRFVLLETAKFKKKLKSFKDYYEYIETLDLNTLDMEEFEQKILPDDVEDHGYIRIEGPINTIER